MNTREDGGPAFPHDARDMGLVASNGMSLRDYFAAKLACSMITRSEWAGMTRHEVALDAYEWADAMLAERAK